MVDFIDTHDFANQILIANTKMRLSPSIYNTRTFVNFLNSIRVRILIFYTELQSLNMKYFKT
jgi:hypothetical protein